MTNSPRFGVILILALLVAIAAGVYLSQQERSMSFGLWPRFEMDEVEAIEITTRKESFSLVREQGVWVVRFAGASADTVPIPADKGKIEGLLAAIAHNRPTQDLGPQAGDGSLYGFNDPAVRILLRSATKNLHDVQIALGNETPTGAAIHAQCSLAPGSVVLLDANILHQFDKPAEHYFDMRLLDLSSEDAQRVSFTGSTGATWSLERHDDTFVFTSPESLRGGTVSASEVRLYLHNLSAFNADSILSGTAAQAAAKSLFSVEVLLLKATTPLRVEFFTLGDSGQQVFGRSSWHPTGFLVDREKAKNLFRMAFDMQWRGVLNYDSTRVERARIFAVAGNQTLAVNKTDAGWVDPEQGHVVQGIDITLWRLKELRIEAEPETRLVPPAEQRLVLELFGKDPKPLAVFTFYSDPRLPAGQCWLKPGGEETYYPVGSQIIEDLQGYLPQRARKPASPVDGVALQRKP